MQFPGYKEWTPVDIILDLAQVVIVEYFGAGELRNGGGKLVPVDGYLILLCLLKGQVLLGCFFVSEIIAQLVVFFTNVFEIAGFLFLVQQRTGNGYAARSIQYVHYAVLVLR